MADGDSIARLARRLDDGWTVVLPALLDQRTVAGLRNMWAQAGTRHPHWGYGRARRPCFRCGTPVRFAPPEATPHGRETWTCPTCRP